MELSGAWERNGFAISGDATYTHGENLSDDRALAQIPPLNGQAAFSYGQDAWRAGARMNWAATQTRIDPALTQVNEPGRSFYVKLEARF